MMSFSSFFIPFRLFCTTFRHTRTSTLIWVTTTSRSTIFRPNWVICVTIIIVIVHDIRLNRVIFLEFVSQIVIARTIVQVV